MDRKLVGIAVGLGLAIGLAVWPSAGDAKKCAKPGLKCNDPTACMLKAQMMGKWGLRAVFRDKKLAAEARKQAEANLKKSHPNNWQQHVEEQAFILLHDSAAAATAKVEIAPCKGSNIAAPPGFNVRHDEYLGKCVMHARVGDKEVRIKDMSKDPYTLVPDTCDEMIDASLVHEGHHMSNCNKGETLDQARKEEADGYTLEIHFLRDEMAHVGKRCTPGKKRRQDYIADLKKATLSAIQHQGATP